MPGSNCIFGIKIAFLLKGFACQLKYDDETKTIGTSGKQKGNSSNNKNVEVHLMILIRMFLLKYQCSISSTKNR